MAVLVLQLAGLAGSRLTEEEFETVGTDYRYLGTVALDDMFVREETLTTKYSFDPAEAERRFGSVFRRNYREENKSFCPTLQQENALDDA